MPQININKKKVAIATVTLAALAEAYYKYDDSIVDKIKHYKKSLTGNIQNAVEEKIENEIIDSVILADS